jgi:hypothetical protein
VGPGTILKSKKFCRDQKQQNFLQGLKPKRDIFAGTKTIF